MRPWRGARAFAWFTRIEQAGTSPATEDAAQAQAREPPQHGWCIDGGSRTCAVVFFLRNLKILNLKFRRRRRRWTDARPTRKAQVSDNGLMPTRG